MKKNADDLSPRVRAEDILLGSLGFGEEAHIVTIERTPLGYRGVGAWANGEEFSFESTDELDELTVWALEVFKEDARGSTASGLPSHRTQTS
jgi:hypothetical protein